QKAIARQTGTESFGNRFLLAQELLSAGQTREAITELENLKRDAGLSEERIAPESKSFFDFLAIAWLRLGAQQNCIDNPVANVCILPLDSAARHIRQEGAREAITRYTRLLRQFPEDYGSKWLLNL